MGALWPGWGGGWELSGQDGEEGGSSLARMERRVGALWPGWGGGWELSGQDGSSNGPNQDPIQPAINFSHSYCLGGGLVNGQEGCQPGEGIMGLLAPIAICLHCQWDAGPAQLLAFGTIGEELAGLCCKGCRTSLVT